MINEDDDGWVRIYDNPDVDFEMTYNRDVAIRDWAYDTYGAINLRGFHSVMRSEGWTYYDILRFASPQEG